MRVLVLAIAIAAPWLASGAPARAQGVGQVFDRVNAIKMLKTADPTKHQPENGAQYPQSPFGQALKQIAQLTKANVGLEVAFADIGGQLGRQFGRVVARDQIHDVVRDQRREPAYMLAGRRQIVGDPHRRRGHHTDAVGVTRKCDSARARGRAAPYGGRRSLSTDTTRFVAMRASADRGR